MFASFAGARQLASFTTDALARERIKILTFIALPFYQRDKDLEALLPLLLLDKVAGAFGQNATYMAI